jgi:hypothetical protein
MAESTHILPRAGIHVTGPGARDFLQGLITQDIAMLANQPMIYTAFLNHHGKFLFDAFIGRLNDAWIIDAASDPARANLMQHLKKYRLRSAVSIDPADISVQVGWGEAPEPGVNQIVSPDPRHPDIGWRCVTYPPPEGGRGPSNAGPEGVTRGVIVGTPTLTLQGGGDQTAPETKSVSRFSDDNYEDPYHRRRIELTIPEGVHDAVSGTSTPEELHLPRLNAVSFTKGCYLGQELTARMEHRGLGKRHLYRVRMIKAFGLDPKASGEKRQDPRVKPEGLNSFQAEENTSIIFLNDKQVGDLRSTCGDIGLALLRDDAVTGMTEIRIEGGENGWVIK